MTLDIGLVLYLSMSEGNDAIVYDKSKQQNNGDITTAIFLRPYEDMSNDSNDEGSQFVVYDDDETFWTPAAEGGGTIGVPTFTEELVEVKKGSSSGEIVVGAGANKNWYLGHTYGGDQDLSSYDYVTVWFYGANSGATIAIFLYDLGFGNNNGYGFTDNFTGWRRFFFPLARPTHAAGALNLANVRHIRLYCLTDNTTGTWYLDRTTIEVGNWHFGEALDFDGTNDYVNCGNANSLCPIETISISAWIYVEGSGHRVIISRYSDNANNKKSWLINAHVGGTLEWNVYVTSANSLLSNLTLPTDEWVHIVCMFDGTTQTIYINGLFDISQALSGNIQYTTTNTLIGALYDAGDAPALFYNGLIDEVRIYNRILSPEEIRTLYELVY